MKRLLGLLGFLMIPLCVTGCAPSGETLAGISIVYAVMALLSLLILMGYCFSSVAKQHWILLLLASVLVVNGGYYSLSVSQTLSEALLANRISYFGSVFLPLSMLMIILDSCGIKSKRGINLILAAISIGVFFLAASPGYSDAYYRSASLQILDGISSLQKEYGPWHILYLFYLVGYFGAMLGVIFHSIRTRKISSTYHSVFLLTAVLVNVGVWLLEQLVHFDFEFLSVSYVISELFLLILFLLQQDQHSAAPVAPYAPETECEFPSPSVEETPQASEEQEDSEDCGRYLLDNLYRLTPTERRIYELYLEGKSTRTIMIDLNITENTLKYHNKNLYGKLGVSSRKQLLRIAAALKSQGVECK